MQQIRQYRQRIQVNKFMLFLIALLLSDCTTKSSKNIRAINVDVLGSYRPNQRFKLKINGKTIYDKTLPEHYIIDRRFVYELKDTGRVSIDFSVNNRDTTFVYEIRKQNYLDFGETLAYRQLLVYSLDSAEYWKNQDDAVKPR